MVRIKKILERHVEDAAFLWLLRNGAVKDPHYDLNDLAEHDERLEAHLDGIRVAGPGVWPIIVENLTLAEPGEVFVAAWFALTFQDGRKLDAVTETIQQGEERVALIRSFCSALVWCPLETVLPWLNGFKNSSQPFYQYLAVAACGLHRHDIGVALEDKIRSSNELVAARALRTAGELGRRDLVDTLAYYHQSDDWDKQFWSLWSSVLLGDDKALNLLKPFIYANAQYSQKALQLYCRKKSPEEATAMVKQLAQNKGTRRLAIQGAGYSGNPFWIPGLIRFMAQPELSRLAGEALSMITGLDLKYLDLDQDEPEGFETGPNDDPADENVALDADEDLPWPNPALILAWWEKNKKNYQPNKRYLCGRSINEATCNHVLAKGYQRQRIAAAYELALMGKDFVNVSQSGLIQNRIFR